MLASRRAPQTFEIRPTPAGRPVGFPHDELMIEWGDVPAGSTGNLYLPADGRRTRSCASPTRPTPAHRLTVVDANTIALPGRRHDLPADPARADGENLAGLLTVDLPAGIRKGERYNITVKQVTAVPVLQRASSGRPRASSAGTG